MQVNKLIRDPNRVHAALRELEDGRLVCVKPVKIYIPVRFEEKGLASLGVETYILGVYAIVVDEVYYGVSTVNAMIRIQPSSYIKIKVDGDDYYEFSFDAGSTVMSTVHLVKTDTIPYRIYDELMGKGRVPWYLDYIAMGRIYDTANYHAGAPVGANQEVTELIVSMIGRSAKDRTLYYRQSINTLEDLVTTPPAWVGLRSVQYAASNTLNKLAGSYFDIGVQSALVSPSTRVERLETILRA